MNDSMLESLQQFDQQRPSIPGEHWIALAAGVALLLKPRGSLVSRLAGAALVFRAASGHDGLASRFGVQLRPTLQAASTRERSEDYIDVAAPWPYDQRVRLAADTLRRAR